MKNKKLIIFTSIFILAMISFNIAYLLMNKNLGKTPKVEPNNNLEKGNISISSNEKKISPNTEIEQRIYFRECGHITNGKYSISEQMINMEQKDFQAYLEKNLPDFKLVSFSKEKIVIAGEKEHLCPNHYIIGEKDGYIAIFDIDLDGEKVLRNVFKDYPIDLLMEIDKNKLVEGIIVDSEEELSNILENFIS